MLKYPNTDIDFVVTPGFFVGDFNVYDREDTLGVRLGKFDPNDESSLREVMDDFFFNGARVSILSSAHKAELLNVLARALSDQSYDFDYFVNHARHCDDFISLPDEWDIQDARELFSRIYRLAVSRWASDVASDL